MNILRTVFSSIGKKTLIPTPIPDYITRPEVNVNYKWNIIPLGVGANKKEVSIDIRTAPHVLISGASGTGKSIIIKNVLTHCIENPSDWEVAIVDLTKIEFPQYIEYDAVSSVVTDLTSTLEVFRNAKKEMYKRYEILEEKGLNNFSDLKNTPEVRKPLLILIDEYATLMAGGVKTDEGRQEDEMSAEIVKISMEIARLGRAAGIHMVLATQRPKLLAEMNGEMKSNFGCNIAAGYLSNEDSLAVLGGDEATHLPTSIKGRGYIKGRGEGEEFQTYHVDSRSELELKLRQGKQ